MPLRAWGVPEETEELWVTTFDGLYSDKWAKTGSSPYLHDSDGDFIHTVAGGDSSGWYLYANYGGAKAFADIKSIKFKMEYYLVADPASGINWWGNSGADNWYIGNIKDLSAVYIWYTSSDKLSQFASWADIDAMKMFVNSYGSGAGWYCRRSYIEIVFAGVPSWGYPRTK